MSGSPNLLPPAPMARRPTEPIRMLDLTYIATGAVFLYICVLYAYACDHL